MSNEVDRLRLRDLFVSNYLEKLFYFCLKKTGDAREAEELASDISLDVLTAIEKYSNPHLKDDIDYYVNSGLFRIRSILACLWKDRGLYSGKSAQFCTLLLS